MLNDHIVELAAVVGTHLGTLTETEKRKFDFDKVNCGCFCARTANDVLQPSLEPLNQHQAEFALVMCNRMDRFTEYDRMQFVVSMMGCNCSWAQLMKKLMWPRVLEQAQKTGMIEVNKVE